MPTMKAVVAAPAGLHARSAAVFVRAVTDTGLPVSINKADDGRVDARSLLQVMTADFPQGCEVELSISENAVEGVLGREKAEDALRQLRDLLESQGPA
ncbi:phosphocarrier protein HPr [Arthrobacter ulcerisalmonis]|uniref:HPr family phosphocarrier protein n=1 Tax=Arthrobacter sp. B1I2 TaxID=3042263 RepID=UPI002783DDB0|nr:MULTISPECIES: HPr family phosphocarrier protein [Arthrobacter]MDQ0664238.1 phosphocarrier protein HPr [Arthrobacter ulcerisalmonis]MDQ0732134.1 phosphocarrier protein HPr [Arthrobacter sp. B1I2]